MQSTRLRSVTVLIPAHNEAEYIERCVMSCWSQTHPPETVMVIADACTDQTSELARRTGATVMEIDERSKPRGLNLALARVDTDLVFLLDADSYLASDAVEQCVGAMDRWGYGGVCTKVRQQPDAMKGMFARARAIEWSATHAWSRRMETAVGWLAVLSGMAGCYRVEALRAVGGWSDDGLCEDVELAMKFNVAGYRPGFAPKAYVYVRDPASLKVYLAQIKRWAAGWAQAIAKHRRMFYTRPQFLFVFGMMLLDSSLLLLSLVILASILGFGPSVENIGGWVGLTYVGMSLWTITLASVELGVRKALMSWPFYALLSPLTSAVSLWTMLREWGLGRHLTSWTGRQGRKAEMTRMPVGRRRVFAGAPMLAAVYTIVALSSAAVVMESTGVLPDLRIPNAVQRVIGGPSSSIPVPVQGNEQNRGPTDVIAGAHASDSARSGTVVDVPVSQVPQGAPPPVTHASMPTRTGPPPNAGQAPMDRPALMTSPPRPTPAAPPAEAPTSTTSPTPGKLDRPGSHSAIDPQSRPPATHRFVWPSD